MTMKTLRLVWPSAANPGISARDASLGFISTGCRMKSMAASRAPAAMSRSIAARSVSPFY